MAESLNFDYNNMMAPRLGGRGIEPDVLSEMAAGFSATHEAVDRRRSAGEIGFFDLPYQDQEVRELRAHADGLAGLFDNVVVLGIGGSALGTTALVQALKPPFWNELDDQGREYYPRLYVLDNVDPATIGPLLDRLDLRRTLFNVVSKSGTTAETMAQYLIVAERLRQLFPDGDHRRNLVFTTDPSRGLLRRLAEEEGVNALSVPPNVGGRFSVLSPVGMFPAAMVGIDVEALLAGARDMDRQCRTGELGQNPAGMFAVLQYLADSRYSAPIHVLMAYSDRLFGLADWFRQLWAESLGKRLDRDERQVFRGPTPVIARGVTDQHSQVQLYMEGPFDKTITFLTALDGGDDISIPQAGDNLSEIGYLGGQSLGKLLNAEFAATAGALTRHERMNMALQLPRVDAHAVGQLIMLLQIATVYAGELYGVNPLDQPGVELGKRLTRELLTGGEADSGEHAPTNRDWTMG